MRNWNPKVPSWECYRTEAGKEYILPKGGIIARQNGKTLNAFVKESIERNLEHAH
jgi:hypothetical protein